MNTSKTSITAIIFVTIYFIFIVFISLFHGLYFKNIKLHNLYIKSLFIKIDKKLILKANSITIIPKQKVSQDIVSIHKQIYYISKIIPMFETFSLQNISYKEIKIPLISYKNKKLHIITDFLKIKGTIYPYKKHTIINNVNIKFKNYYINSINGSITFDKNIFFKIKGHYNKYIFNLEGKLDKNDELFLKISTDKMKIHFNKYLIYVKKLISKIKLNLHYINPTVFLKASKISVDKNYFIYSLYTKYSNKALKFKFEKAKISSLKDLKNVTASYTEGTYFQKDKMLIISFNKYIYFNYKKAFIFFDKNSLIFKNINNFNFYSNSIYAKYEDYKLHSQNAIILKFGNFILFEIKNNTLKDKIIDIYNDIVYGYKNRIEVPNIKAKYKKININIQNLLINLKLKKAVIDKIFIDKFLFSPTFISLKDNQIDISTSSSNILIDKDFHKILNEFNISIPVTQLQGKNRLKIDADVNIKNKNFDFLANINSKNSVFKYNDIMFSYSDLNATVNKKEVNASIKNIFTSLDFLKVSADGNLSVNQKYLNSYALIKELKILNFVNVKNFKEKIVADFKNKIIYFLNSNIYINISQNEIFLLKLKDLIKYTPFKNIVEDGGVFIKIANEVLISGILQLKKPVIMNQENPKIINAMIFIKDTNITVENDYIHLKITDLKDYNARIKNADINIKNLIDIYNELSKVLINNSSKNKDTNTTFKILSENTNFIYENHKFLSQKAELTYDKNLKVFSKYKTSTLRGYTKQGYFLLEGKNYHKEELSALLDFFNHFKKVNLDFILVKSPDDFYTGKIYLNKSILNELTALNNIVAFLNTIPSLLSLSSPGFSAKGYKIKKGLISYLFYQNILYLKQIKIIGENIDFYGKGYIDLNKNTINMKLMAALKMKIKKIPIVGKGLSYILFGKDGNIDVKIIVKGKLDNPKVTQDIGKSIILTPFELFKRVITLPFNLF